MFCMLILKKLVLFIVGGEEIFGIYLFYLMRIKLDFFFVFVILMDVFG